MTRENRKERLKALWKKIPINHYGITDRGDFMRWTGLTATLLSFNPHLQSEFRNEIKIISDDKHSDSLTFGPRFKPNYSRILVVLSEAINELEIGEESVGLLLTDEHGIWWFINHCTWKSRLIALGAIVGGAATIFGVGFKIGTTEVAQNLYRQYMSLPAPTPTIAPSTAPPTK
jgi:hypothetical protein